RNQCWSRTGNHGDVPTVGTDWRGVGLKRDPEGAVPIDIQDHDSEVVRALGCTMQQRKTMADLIDRQPSFKGAIVFSRVQWIDRICSFLHRACKNSWHAVSGGERQKCETTNV